MGQPIISRLQASAITLFLALEAIYMQKVFILQRFITINAISIILLC